MADTSAEIAAAPSPTTYGGQSHNLPAQPNALIGREWDIANVRALLLRSDVRLVTLTGPGGTGKTRLALHVAADLLDQFADGTWFVALAPLADSQLVASAIAQALGVKEAGDRPIADSLRQYLHPRKMLLVLDNFEQLLEAAPLLAELLASAPGLKILATSRVTLRLSGEYEYAVPPLALPDRANLPSHERLGGYAAVRLFVERARAARADFTSR